MGVLNHKITEIINSYSINKTLPLNNNRLARIIRDVLPASIQGMAKLESEIYRVYGSAGQGNWAEVPWIAICNKSICKSVSTGIYIVYLFSDNGVYLSLNMGWTYYLNKYGVKHGRIHISKVAESFRRELGTFTPLEFQLENINLNANGTLGKGYELGHIFGKFYAKNDIPDDNKILSDVSSMIELYDHIIRVIDGEKIDLIFDELIRNGNFILFTDDEEEKYQLMQSNLQEPENFEIVDSPEKRIDELNKGVNIIEKWPRNVNKAKKAIVIAGYKCEIDSNHMTFISEVSGQQYMEAHHFIPMSEQKNFKYSLDIISNIVSLCPNCHRSIHFSNQAEKKKNIGLLYSMRSKRLRNAGIEISLNELQEIYGIHNVNSTINDLRDPANRYNEKNI